MHGVEMEAVVVVGSVVLRDNAGKELNLDGTVKTPYRHPNFASNKIDNHHTNGQQQQLPMQQAEMGTIEEWPDGQRHRQFAPNDSRRPILTVKPAELNISE